MANAIYAGSFDAFTNGHLEIINQASKIFDKLDVVIAVNSEKKRRYSVQEMYMAMDQAITQHNVDILILRDKMVAQEAKSRNVEFLVRGLRDEKDFSYEKSIAKINQEIYPGLNTIYLQSKNEIISSSMVEEFHKYGVDVSPYVPKSVYLAFFTS